MENAASRPKNSEQVSRRKFIKYSGAVGAAAVGIFAFPVGTQLVEALSPGTTKVIQLDPLRKIASLDDLVEGEPLDFQYPSEEHSNFIVKLGSVALDGVGPDKDVVAFNYLCSHMGCPLNGTYRHDYSMLGPCPCHFSRFDLSKNGLLILGQATQSLPQIVLEVRESEIYAIGVMGLLYGLWNNLNETVE